MVRLAVGYPDRAEEHDVLLRRVARRAEAVSVDPVVDAATVLALQAGVEACSVDPDVAYYCVDLAAATRRDPRLELGASPRGSQSLLILARALAAMDGRDFALPEDVKRVAVPALAHRVVVTPTAWASGVQPDQVVADLLDQVAGPPSADAA